MVSVWRYNQNKLQDSETAPDEPYSIPQLLLIRHAKDLIRIANESLVIAGTSKVLEARQSRINIAKKSLSELKQIAQKNPYMRLTRLDDFERDIARVEQEINAASAKYPNSDIISGLQFCATMQLRTPLRVLSRHGEIFTDLPNHPPMIARELWEGIWIQKMRSLRELGIDADEPPSGFIASSIGSIPVDGGDYLKFLIAVRKIVESANPIEDRIARLKAEAANSKWTSFSNHRFHRSHDIADYFFPLFLNSIPRLSQISIAELVRLGVDAPMSLDGAGDSALLAIRGIGPKILGEIRTACAKVMVYRESTRIDTVRR